MPGWAWLLIGWIGGSLAVGLLLGSLAAATRSRKRAALDHRLVPFPDMTPDVDDAALEAETASDAAAEHEPTHRSTLPSPGGLGAGPRARGKVWSRRRGGSPELPEERPAER